MTSLYTLHLCGLEDLVTDSLVIALVQACPDLQNVGLARSDITDEALKVTQRARTHTHARVTVRLLLMTSGLPPHKGSSAYAAPHNGTVPSPTATPSCARRPWWASSTSSCWT